MQLQVLVADDEIIPNIADQPGLTLTRVSALLDFKLVGKIVNKYAHRDQNFVRWSLKPVWVSYLLENGYDRVIFGDCDLFFYNDYSFLFDELNHANIILTRQWYPRTPEHDEASFRLLFTNGAFNAGFIGATKEGLPALNWWAEACLNKIGHYPEEGIYVDQRYLDFIPILFKGVHILEHKGCNIGSSSQEECPRTLVNGKVVIADKYPVVFVHYYSALVKEILMGYEPLLRPYYEEFKSVFEEYGIPYEHFKEEIHQYFGASLAAKLKWKMKIRTRIKSFFFKLSNKL